MYGLRKLGKRGASTKKRGSWPGWIAPRFCARTVAPVVPVAGRHWYPPPQLRPAGNRYRGLDGRVAVNVVESRVEVDGISPANHKTSVIRVVREANPRLEVLPAVRDFLESSRTESGSDVSQNGLGPVSRCTVKLCSTFAAWPKNSQRRPRLRVRSGRIFQSS